ncbi:shieldin complex subunit 1 isoform X2 [Cervus elaphus]|uniref:shieldin complex subunit 1 isoform X3 n=1 Tax=Cervus canadensis TaxID=1574408 RepID=UPI001C9E9730|nr:shieldin complex subunit 1 isoform X3 [Cervus canadensis]XP_043739717.1 shieldin complex subunit 1 isoform X2 [Cervus elaphus]
MATQETTPGSQTEESNALDLPSAYDIRDYVLQRPRQETNSEAFSSEEACSIPCSSDVDPAKCSTFEAAIGNILLNKFCASKTILSNYTPPEDWRRHRV